MKSGYWAGDWPITAGWRYSSGTGHYSYDVGMPTGTKVYAGVDGEVLDLADGVPNNPGGVNPGSGAPSNWVLVGTKYKGRKVCVYYQHLSPGVKVKRGARVNPTTHLANSGNSGNSTGPHLHCTAQEGWKSAYNRYDYLDNGGASAIYPPTLVEQGDDVALTEDDIKKIAKQVWLYNIDVSTTSKPDQMHASNVLKQARNQAKGANESPSPGAPAIADEVWAEVLTTKDADEAVAARKMVRQTWNNTKPKGSTQSVSTFGTDEPTAEPAGARHAAPSKFSGGTLGVVAFVAVLALVIVAYYLGAAQ